MGNNEETPNVKTQYWLLHEKAVYQSWEINGTFNTTSQTVNPILEWVLCGNLHTIPKVETQHRALCGESKQRLGIRWDFVTGKTTNFQTWEIMKKLPM